MEDAKNRILLGLAIAGAIILLGILSWLNPMSSWSGMGPVLIVVGLLVAVGVYFVPMMADAGRRSQPPKSVPHSRVMSRYAINDVGEMIFSNFDYDAVGGRFYVKLEFGDGFSAEYECSYPVFLQCGEGMWGTAVVQGKWLGQFIPAVIAPPTPQNF